MMTCFRFRTACLLGLGALASLTMVVCARRAPPGSFATPSRRPGQPPGRTAGPCQCDLTLRGSALSGNPRLVAPFRFAIETPTPGDSDAAAFKARITVDPPPRSASTRSEWSPTRGCPIRSRSPSDSSPRSRKRKTIITSTGKPMRPTGPLRGSRPHGDRRRAAERTT